MDGTGAHAGPPVLMGSRAPCRFPLLLPALLLLLSCATLETPPASTLKKYAIPLPTPERFRVCTNFGCRETRETFLTPAEWGRIAALFEPPATTPERERDCVAQAIGLFEALVGHKVGTDRDAPGNDWNAEWSPQLDCIAEAVNSTVYLLLLEDADLLRHHRVAHPFRRGFLFIFAHNTAVILEKATGSAHAVDSWFHANGAPPEIVPLRKWTSGYRP
jgi:hypothetical protein